jgi:hypothetical protein
MDRLLDEIEVSMFPPAPLTCHAALASQHPSECLADHAEILALKGDSYRLKDRDLTRATPTE